MRAHVEIINLKFCLGIQIQPSKSFQKMKSKTIVKALKNTGESKNISRTAFNLLWTYRAKESAIENNKIQKRMEKRQSFLFRKPDLSTQENILNYLSDFLTQPRNFKI